MRDRCCGSVDHASRFNQPHRRPPFPADFYVQVTFLATSQPQHQLRKNRLSKITWNSFLRIFIMFAPSLFRRSALRTFQPLAVCFPGDFLSFSVTYCAPSTNSFDLISMIDYRGARTSIFQGDHTMSALPCIMNPSSHKRVFRAFSRLRPSTLHGRNTNKVW
jgi:hypothetical protein